MCVLYDEAVAQHSPTVQVHGNHCRALGRMSVHFRRECDAARKQPGALPAATCIQCKAVESELGRVAYILAGLTQSVADSCADSTGSAVLDGRRDSARARH